MSEPSDKVVIDVVLAEFNALQDEIRGRSSSAFTLLNINITATAAIAGFVLADKADSRLLLILPLLSPALGLLFIDHSYNIKNLGAYIHTQLRPIVLNHLNHHVPRLLGYGDFVERYEQNAFLRFFPLGLPLILLFAGFPLVAWIYTVGIVQQPWERFLSGVGFLMIVSYLVLWGRFLLEPLQRSRRKDPPSARSNDSNL